jgi:hypothetical protein
MIGACGVADQLACELGLGLLDRDRCARQRGAGRVGYVADNGAVKDLGVGDWCGRDECREKREQYNTGTTRD